jgi:hypothetical protein
MRQHQPAPQSTGQGASPKTRRNRFRSRVFIDIDEDLLRASTTFKALGTACPFFTSNTEIDLTVEQHHLLINVAGGTVTRSSLLNFLWGGLSETQLSKSERHKHEKYFEEDGRAAKVKNIWRKFSSLSRLD